MLVAHRLEGCRARKTGEACSPFVEASYYQSRFEVTM